MSFSLFFQDRVLAFDVKGENLNAQPSTVETVAMNFENKKWCFGQKSEKTQNLLFGNKTFDQKKRFWSKIFLFQNKKFVQKNCLVKKCFGSKEFWSGKIIDQKKFWSQNFFRCKKLLVKKNFGQKIFGQKNFWSKNF